MKRRRKWHSWLGKSEALRQNTAKPPSERKITLRRNQLHARVKSHGPIADPITGTLSYPPVQ